MIQLTGQVINLFSTEGGINKDGQKYESSNKVQLLGNIVLPNGDTKMDLMDLKVDDLKDWEVCKGKKIIIEAGVYAPAKNNIIFSVRKGAKPHIIN